MVLFGIGRTTTRLVYEGLALILTRLKWTKRRIFLLDRLLAYIEGKHDRNL